MTRPRPGLGALALLALLALLAGCALGPVFEPPAIAPAVSPPAPPAPTASAATAPATPAAPGPRHEFRAAWVATVANIDWPSKPGLPAATQRAEALAILDRARAIGLNALILQVRPAGDAVYASALEPWSEVLSGEQGRPPQRPGEPPWDPLAFWVEQAHRRGLELHAWFNPFRARHSTAKSPLALPHIGLRRPALVKRYGDLLWMDPGEPEAVAHTLAVVADVLRRYDIDGVHLDDYFYPYPVPGPGGADLPFPDEESWAAYRLHGGNLARDDWRRANVDGLVQALWRQTRALKPCARLGISPFGIGRPDRRPPGISGFSQVDRLFADVERWLAEGWLDYLAPQLYWPIAREGQAFAPLLDYWAAQNPARRQIWPGLYTSQIAAPGSRPDPRPESRAWPAREVLEQIRLTRARGGDGVVSGHIHFSMSALMQDRDGIATLLQQGPYAEPALPVNPPAGCKPGPPSPGAP